MPLSPKLRKAYEEADYVVLADPEFVLKIGEPSARLDALLDQEGAPSAIFITPANPRSEPRPAAENAAALEKLDLIVAGAGYPWRAAEGRELGGAWREPGRLVIGMWREHAETLGRLFRQNAIVWIERGKAPELVVLV